MVGKSSKVGIIFEEDGKQYFRCAQTGFLIDTRVSFPYEVLQANNAVTLLNGLSFIDWNNAVSHVRDLCNQKEISYKHRMGLEEYVLKVNNMGNDQSIEMPPAKTMSYPNNHKGGVGPIDFAAEYTPLLGGMQTIDDYLKLASAANPPKQLTPEQEANKLKTLQSLKSRTNLNFEVRIPASEAEIHEEEARIKEIDEKEKKIQEELAAPPPADGKSKGKRKAGLTLKDKSRKKRKIGQDGFRPLNWISGETDSASLLSNLLGVPITEAYPTESVVNVSLSKTAQSTCLTIYNPKTTAVSQFHLPLKM
jgi:hypothetical protein